MRYRATDGNPVGGAAPERRARAPNLRRLAVLRDSFVVQIAAALVGYRLLSRLLSSATRLGVESYFRPSIFVESLSRPTFVALLVLATAPLVVWRKRLYWPSIDGGGASRLVVVGLAFLFAWTIATASKNYFFGEAYVLDRALALALAVSLIAHPLFVAPFTMVLLVVLGQLDYPLAEAASHWADKKMLVDALVLFWSLLYVRLIFGASKRNRCVFLLLCLVGSVYAHAAINKALLGPRPFTWVIDDRMTNLLVSFRLQTGWLGFWPVEKVAALADRLEPLSPLLCGAALLVEGCGLCLLLRRKASVCFLGGFVALHLMVLAMTGIFFWKFMFMNLLLMVYLGEGRVPAWIRRHLRAEGARKLEGAFGLRAATIGLVVVLLGPLIFPGVGFAWFDAKVCNFFSVTGVSASGRAYRLDPRFFAPYDLIMSQSFHYYLSRRPVLVEAMGTTQDYDTVLALENAAVDDVGAMRMRFGVDRRRSPVATGAFTWYLNNSVKRKLAEGASRSWLQALATPFHFQRWQAPDAFAYQEKLERIEVFFEEYFFKHGVVHRTARDSVLSLPLDRH